jgi:hypothetical protein
MPAELELTIDFGASGNSQSYLGGGWARPELSFTWAVGSESHVVVPCGAGEYILILDLVPFVHVPGLSAQRLIVSVNDTVVGSSSFARPTLLGYRIPAELVRESGHLTIVLQHPDAARPADFQATEDDRLLAFSMMEARLYRVSAGAGDTAWRLPPGTMMDWGGGRFGLPRHGDLAERVAERTGLDFAQMALNFESMGENCEFGLVQRHCGAEPLGLLRFSSTFMRSLIRGLDTDFEGLGEPDDVEPYLSGDAPREYMIHEKKFGLTYHSFIYEGQRSVWLMREQEAARMKYLRREFVDELGEGDKIFVYKRNAPVTDEEVLPLLMALRRRGDNTLLWVVPTERNRPAGSVEVMMPGLLKGYMDRFAPEDDAYDFSFENWMKVCANALALARLCRGQS